MQAKRLKIIVIVAIFSVFYCFGHSFAADPITVWYDIVWYAYPPEVYLIVGIYPNETAANEAMQGNCESPWQVRESYYNPFFWPDYYACGCTLDGDEIGEPERNYDLIYLWPIDGILPEQTEPGLDLKSRGN